MIASGAFILLLLTLLSMRWQKQRVTIGLFLVCLLAISLLFAHHASDALRIAL